MNDEYVMTPREYDRYIDCVQLERDDALARVRDLEAFIIVHIEKFTRYVPLNNVFQCTICEKYDFRARRREAVVHENDCTLVAILATIATTAEKGDAVWVSCPCDCHKSGHALHYQCPQLCTEGEILLTPTADTEETIKP